MRAPRRFAIARLIRRSINRVPDRHAGGSLRIPHAPDFRIQASVAQWNEEHVQHVGFRERGRNQRDADPVGNKGYDTHPMSYLMPDLWGEIDSETSRNDRLMIVRRYIASEENEFLVLQFREADSFCRGVSVSIRKAGDERL